MAMLTWLVLGLIVGFLASRLMGAGGYGLLGDAVIGILGAVIGANPDNDFASFVYNFAGVFLSPFFSLIGSPSSDGMVLEIPSLIGMLVYALLGWLIVRAILPPFDRPTTRSSSTYDRTRS